MVVRAKTPQAAQPRPLETWIDSYARWLSPLTAVVIFFVLLVIGADLNRLDLRVVTLGLMWVVVASSWNLIGGYTGYVDFGHVMFFGLGAYAAGILVVLGHPLPLVGLKLQTSFGASLASAFFVGALAAGAIGWPTLRLKGPYFSIAMLGASVATAQIVRNAVSFTRGGIGISFRAPFADPLTVYYIMLGLAAATFAISMWIYRSQLGNMLQAIREDEVGADMRGINTTAIKITIFMLAGGITAMVGATRAWWQTYTDPEIAFPEEFTIQVIMMVMLGGIGRPWGPVIGAVLFFWGQTTIWANVGGIHLLITGIALGFIVLFFPKGILGLLDPEDRGLPWTLRQILGRFGYVMLPADRPAAQDGEDEIVPAALLAESPPTVEVAANGAKQLGEVVLQGYGVTRDFGGLRAVNKVDFEIREREIVGLLGPNGSGKTTLFNCISGVIPATEGEIFLNGERITHRAPWRISRAGLSRTFQRLRLYKSLTAYSNMLLARKWRGVPPWLWLWLAPPSVRAQATDLLEFLKLAQVQQNLARNLSGGQQRLLEIGMSLMSNPTVVLLDEATSGVNPALVDEIKNDIRRLNRERGVTFFLIEHNMNFAMDICERLYVLDYGSLIAEGKPEEIQDNAAVIEAYFGRDE